MRLMLLRAELDAHHGDLERADRRIAEFIATVDPTQWPQYLAAAHIVRAEWRLAAGDTERAADALHSVRALAETAYLPPFSPLGVRITRITRALETDA